MRARGKLTLCLVWALFLSGCAVSREPNELAVVRVLSADGGAESMTVTAFPARVESGGETGDAEARSGTGVTPAEACLDLAADGGSYAFLGHTEHLLAGEQLARNGLKPLLENAVLGSGLRPDAYLWVVRGDTGAMWAQDAGGDRAAETLTAYCTSTGTRRKTMAWTAAQTLNRLLRSGAAAAPVLAAGGQEPAGYAILRPDGLAGYLEGDAADGLSFVLGENCHHTLTCDGVTVEVTDVCTELTPVWDNGVFTGLSLSCTVTARWADGSRAEPDALSAAEAALAARTERQMKETLRRLGELNADGAELLHRTLASSPLREADIRDAWPEELAGLQVQCAAEAHIDF